MNNNSIRFVFAVVLFVSMAFANEQTVFTGSETKLDIAITQSDAIFVGRIEEIGPPVIKALGEKSYYGIKVKIVRLLKGAAGPDVSVTLITRTDTNVKEMAPEAHKSYIFIVKKKNAGSQFQVLKLLPADDVTVLQVKKLIVP